VRIPLKEQGVFDLIDGPKAMFTLPQVIEKEKREQHLKSQIWYIGTSINISLRGAEYNGVPESHPLLRGMFDLLAILRRGVYGSKGIDAMKGPFKRFLKDWKKEIQPYKGERSMWSTPLIENMDIASTKISEILKE
jgi:hypothetical protein